MSCARPRFRSTAALAIAAALAVTACSGDGSGNTTVSPTGPSEPTADDDIESAAEFFAEAWNLDPDCTKTQFAGTSEAELAEVGITSLGTLDASTQLLVAKADQPVFELVMVTAASCSEAFGELVREDLGDQLEPDILECLIEEGPSDPDVVALHFLGVRPGSTIDDYPTAARDRMTTGAAKRQVILESCAAAKT